MFACLGRAARAVKDTAVAKGGRKLRLVLHIAVITLLAVAILANGGLAAGIYATREPAPKPLTAERIEKASEPAIVLVQSNYSIDASLPFMVISDAKYNEVINKVQSMIYSGQVTSLPQAYRAAINLVVSNPAEYYGRGTVSKGAFDFLSTGSGFFATEDGYLVTASHVVSADKADLRTRALATYNEPDAVATDRSNLANDLIAELGFEGDGVSLTAAQQNTIEAFWQRWVAKYLSLDKIDVKYYLGSGNVEAGDRLTSNGVRASVVSIDPTSTGHDVAILKADLTGVPTLPLGTGTPRIGDVTYAVGYPRQGYLDESVPANQVIPATMSTGKISLMDTRSTGWTAYGTTATLTHGDSGGPVLDAKGHVMGLVSYSRVDDTGKQVYGGGFFVPSQYILADLEKAFVTVKNDPTNLTNSYYHALAEGDIQRYRVELPILQSIEARSPFDAYVKDDIIATQSEVLTGRDRTPPDLVPYVAFANAAAVTFVLLTLIAWLGLAVSARRPRRVLSAVSVDAAEQRPPPAPVAPAWPERGTDVVASAQEMLRESAPVATVSVAPGEEAPSPPAGAPTS